jgi:cytochrome c-type biogenesis protein CcmH/NrfG
MRYHNSRLHDELQYAECITSFELALAINPLYMESWFSLGCAAMRLSQWEKAVRAFARVVQLDIDVRV